MSQTDEEKNQLELELAAAKSQAAELGGAGGRGRFGGKGKAAFV